MNNSLRHLLVVVLMSLGACAPAPLKKLDAPMAEAEKADHVVIFLAQSEVAVDDVDVNNGAGGLLGALIEVAMESTMTRNRQKAIEPLRNTLLDYEYEAKLIAALQSHLPTSLVKSGAPIKIVRNDQEYRDHIASVVPANVFVVNSRYAFEQNFEIAYVHAVAAMHKHTRVPPTEKDWKNMSVKQRKAIAPALLHTGSYYAEGVTHSPFIKQQKAKGEAGFERNAAAWAVDQAEPVRLVFARALDEVASLIQRDGEGSLPVTPAKKDIRVFVAHSYLQPMLLRGTRIEQADGRSLVVIGQNMHWIDHRQIKQKK